jgi:hypothetical protein
MEGDITESDTEERRRPTKKRRELLEIGDTNRRGWHLQTELEVPVKMEQGFEPTTFMPTMVLVEEVHTRDSRILHIPHMAIPCADGLTRWRLCGQQDCYGCYFKANAVTRMDSSTEKGQTEKIIGDWTKRAHWEK